MRQLRHLKRCGVFLISCALLAAPGGAESIRIKSQRANVRERPTTQSRVLVTLTAGTVLDIEGREGEWYKVLLPENAVVKRRAGYLHEGTAELAVPDTATTLPAWCCRNRGS